MNKQREYRSMEMRVLDNEEVSYRVEGYASTFERYKLFEDEDTEYFEQIDPKAFDEADMRVPCMPEPQPGQLRYGLMSTDWLRGLT